MNLWQQFVHENQLLLSSHAEYLIVMYTAAEIMQRQGNWNVIPILSAMIT